MSTHIFRSLVLLLFVSGLVAFFLMNPGRWRSPRVAEPLVVGVKASPDLTAWLEHARTRFLENNPRIAGRPLSLIINYEEDAAASGAVAERLSGIPSPSSALSADAAWLTSRAAVHLLESTHRLRMPDKAVVPLASTLLTVAMWEALARDILPSAGVVLPRSQPGPWRNMDVSWAVWHRLSVGPSQGRPAEKTLLRWAIPHPLRSAAGLASLALISLSDAGLQGGRWPDEQEEQTLLPRLSDFFRTVHRFRPSAYETANDFSKYGPSQANVALLLEHLALEVVAQVAERAGPGVVLLYPRVNAVYEYVFVDVSGSTAHPQQREGIMAFQRFLRAEEGQRLGLAHGLRPVLPDLTPRPTDPWPRFSAQGAQFAPPVTWIDVQAGVEPASRLASRVMEQLHTH